MPDALTEQKIADFRQKVCDAAVRQLTEHGIENLSMRSLAKELGYSATALYSYFRNKDDILAAARTEAFNRLADSMEAALQVSPDPRMKLKVAVDVYSSFAATDSTAYKLAFASDQPSPSHYPELQLAESRFRQILIQLMDNLVATGQMTGDPEVLALAYWAALHGIISLRLAGIIVPEEAVFGSIWQEIQSILSRGAAGKKASQKATDKQFNLDL